jgi:hypothetical protein
MSERNVIQCAFDDFGRDAGAEKKSGSWYRRSDEVIAVLNLQKSQYGPSYYFNLGFWLREIDDERYPKAHRLHISTRLGGLLPAAEKRIDDLLDLGCAMGDEQRTRELRTLLEDELFPLVERGGSTVEGLRSMRRDGLFRRAGLTGPALQVLGSD